MNPTLIAATSLALVALLSGAAVPTSAAARAGQQDDPFEKLKTYDFQARQPVEAIRLMIDKSLTDKTDTAPIEQKLDELLADANATFAGKQEAARFLWMIGTSRSVPVLSRLLVDEKLSNIARYALERDAGPAAGKALVAALPVVHGTVLVGVINSIGDRGDADAAYSLRHYANDSDALVAESATVALGKIGTQAAVTILKSLPADSVTAGVALRRAAEKMAATGRSSEAAQVYGILWNAVRPSNIRGEAVRGLANIMAPNAAAVALAALKSDDPYLQIVAAQVISTRNDPKATGAAIAAWPNVPLPAQIALLTVLADKRDVAAASIATTATESKDPALRAAGIRAAGQVGGAAAVPRLIDIMMQGEGGDRNVAREALAGMPGADVEKAILDQVRQGKPEVRAALMTVLVDRPTAGAMIVLMDAARGVDPRSAAEAIRALGRVGGMKEHRDLLNLLLTTPSDEVRDAARDSVVAIGQRMGDRARAAAPVLAAYTGASPAAKAALLGALAETGGDGALEELIRSATSTDAALKLAAIRALAETWSDSRPLPTLLGIAKSDPDKALRVQALRGYLRLAGQDESMSAQNKVARIGDALKIAERPEEKRQAISVLRDARTLEAVQMAAQFLSDPDLFGDAANTILYLAGPQRKNNRDLPAVKGDATSAALDKIIQTTKDDDQRNLAQKLK